MATCPPSPTRFAAGPDTPSTIRRVFATTTTYPGRSAGFRPEGPVGRRTRGRRLMAQQKSEDRVVPDGGVMPVQPMGSSAGGQGKAVPVEEAVSQLRLPIATAEAPGGGSGNRSPDRSGGRTGARAPKAIVNERTGVPATMDEVVERLGSALLRVVSKKGAPGPDGMTVEALQAQWPLTRATRQQGVHAALRCVVALPAPASLHTREVAGSKAVPILARASATL